MRPNSRRSTLAAGVTLVVAGLVFLLNGLGLFPSELFDWWPLLVISAGLWMLATAATRRRTGLVAGVVLSGLGVYWLLDNLGLVAGELFMPVLLVSLGAGLVLRNVLGTAS